MQTNASNINKKLSSSGEPKIKESKALKYSHERAKLFNKIAFELTFVKTKLWFDYIKLEERKIVYGGWENIWIDFNNFYKL